jgi:hypothetical protein
MSKKDRETAVREGSTIPRAGSRREATAIVGALKKAVPRPELAIGKKIDCTCEEYREHARHFLEDAGHADRETLDLLVAFGSDACRSRSKTKPDEIEPTPFRFTTFPLPPDTIRSLLQLGELADPGHHRPILRTWGIAAIFRSRRIKVGAGSNRKLNFSPRARCEG